MTQWRVIYDEPRSGAENMAIDQAIMEAVGRDVMPPTLRLYRWQPACLSLGYAQSVSDVDVERLQQHGWDLVRRPTGGKAILHTDELTYSVALPEDNPVVRGGVIESYRRLSSALLAGLERLAVSADITSREEAGRATGAVCFEVPSDYEVTAAGRKLIGSAQVRRQQTVLQHGTIPLYGDVSRICDALVFADDLARQTARDHVQSCATTIERVVGKRLKWQTVAEALQISFAETFNLDLRQGTLSSAEWNRAEELIETVYDSTDWTQKR